MIVFSKIIKKGNFVLANGVKSSYDYNYGSLSDTMNEAYCSVLLHKLEDWQKEHGAFNIVVGIETEGIRIGYELAYSMDLPFYIMPHKSTELAQLGWPKHTPDTHWLIVDDIVTTGSSLLNAVDLLGIEEKPESVTFASMIRRNPKNLDYSDVAGDPKKEQSFVRDERFDFIDKRLVYLFAEPE